LGDVRRAVEDGRADPFQSAIIGEPSAYLSSLGTTVHPRRTPVKPMGLEKELTSMAHSRAPPISKIDFGRLGSRMYSA
jgi:hypothetical protein